MKLDLFTDASKTCEDKSNNNASYYQRFRVSSAQNTDAQKLIIDQNNTTANKCEILYWI